MDTVRTWLEDCQQYKRLYGLRRMQAVLAALGNPQDRLTTIHVTGTNGKGSTIAMISTLLQSHDYQVGAFVSPHLIDVTDRFLMNGRPMSETDFQTVGQHVRQVSDSLSSEWGHLSFFEAVTAMAFVYFAQEKVDVALIEVGIGGLLDTTNVIQSAVSVITSIGMDHQDMLGETEEAITIQKTGIIKPHQPVVLGKVSHEVREIATIVASAYESTLLAQGQDFMIETTESGLRFKSEQGMLLIPRLGLMGTYQVDNAAVALQTFLVFMEEQDRTWSQERIQQALATTQWAGRMEVMQEEPLIVLDGAHNLHAMRRFVETVRHQQGQGQQTILFAALRRKDYHQMLDYLHEQLPDARIVVTTFAFPGAITASDVSDEIFVDDATSFIDAYRAVASDSEQLWITGSLYFLSEIRKNFR